MASVKGYSGPPFRAMNRWPFSSNSAVMTMPAGRGPLSPYRAMSPSRESLKMLV